MNHKCQRKSDNTIKITINWWKVYKSILFMQLGQLNDDYFISPFKNKKLVSLFLL